MDEQRVISSSIHRPMPLSKRTSIVGSRTVARAHTHDTHVVKTHEVIIIAKEKFISSMETNHEHAWMDRGSFHCQRIFPSSDAFVENYHIVEQLVTRSAHTWQ